MVSSVFCLSNSPFALYFSLLWNFSGRFTEGTVLAYKNRTTGGLYRVEVPTPTFLEGEFAACNFRVATKSSSHALWVAQYIQRTKRSVRPQLFKWWIPLSTVDNFELVFIISIAIYPVDRAITAFERPELGHASRGLLQEVKNNENVKTVAPMQRVVAVNLLRKARGPGVVLGLILLGMCSWPLRAPTPLPLPHWPITKEIQFQYNNKKLNWGQLLWPAACILINKESDDAKLYFNLTVLIRCNWLACDLLKPLRWLFDFREKGI